MPLLLAAAAKSVFGQINAENILLQRMVSGDHSRASLHTRTRPFPHVVTLLVHGAKDTLVATLLVHVSHGAKDTHPTYGVGKVDLVRGVLRGVHIRVVLPHGCLAYVHTNPGGEEQARSGVVHTVLRATAVCTASSLVRSFSFIFLFGGVACNLSRLYVCPLSRLYVCP